MMEKNKTDEIFRERIGNLDNMPENVRWSNDKGWRDYEKKYLKKEIAARRLFLLVSSSAAAIILAFFAIMVFRNVPSGIKLASNDSDKVMEILLPDGNRIWLNKSSVIAYPSRIDRTHCEFSVEGEAYFEIRKLENPTYRVKARNAVILVENRGAFNVRARKQEENVNITVASGAVKIMEESYQAGLALLVTQGNYCSVHRSQNLVYVSGNLNENYLAWKTGRLTFKDMPMATVTDVLADYYRTPIVLEDKSLAYCLFSGTFKGQPIDSILHQMQEDLNFVISNTGDKIMISGKGCL
jgi:transmembrane sensor